MKIEITQKILLELLDYDSETGILTWKERDRKWFRSSGKNTSLGNCTRWNKRFAGKIAFNDMHKNGYKQGRILGGTYLAHRIIYLRHHGHLPTEIDHINGIYDDNRICNLESSDRSKNMRNSKKPSHNKSGVIGVYYDKKLKKWASFIRIQKKQTRLGLFCDFEEAVKVRKEAEKMNGYHINHGR